jgi:hypothetical protein
VSHQIIWLLSVRGLHGLGQVAQIRFGSGPNSGLVQMIAIRHFRLSRAILFRKEKVIRTCSHIMLITPLGSETDSTDLILSGIFVAAPPRNI